MWTRGKGTVLGLRGDTLEVSLGAPRVGVGVVRGRLLQKSPRRCRCRSHTLRLGPYEAGDDWTGYDKGCGVTRRFV